MGFPLTASLVPFHFDLKLPLEASMDKLIEEGRYTSVSRNFFSETAGQKLAEAVASHQGAMRRVTYNPPKKVMFLECRGQARTFEDIDFYCRRYNVVPATLLELLAFGIRYGELQRTIPIAALGTRVEIGERTLVPVLCGDSKCRELVLYPVQYAGPRFLVSRATDSIR